MDRDFHGPRNICFMSKLNGGINFEQRGNSETHAGITLFWIENNRSFNPRIEFGSFRDPNCFSLIGEEVTVESITHTSAEQNGGQLPRLNKESGMGSRCRG